MFIKLDSPGHPLNLPFGDGGFDYRDEFFRVHDPYSRDRVRVLLSIDTAKTDLTPKDPRWKQERDDNDYALAWVRNYGRGRIFYCTIAHNPSVFSDPKMLQFYLAATQFALGDLPAPTTPSGKLTPAVRAREKLGWRLGITAYTFHKYTLFEAIDKTAELGLSYLGGLSFQKVSEEIPKNFDCELNDDELKQIRLKLDSAGVRLLTHYYARIPGDEEGCRRVFEFGRKMGVEAFISEPPLDALDTIEKMLRRVRRQTRPSQPRPPGLAALLASRETPGSLPGPQRTYRGMPRPRLLDAIGHQPDGRPENAGRSPDMRADARPRRGIDRRPRRGRGGPASGGWSSSYGKSSVLDVQPVMFGLEYSYDWFDSMPEIARSVEFFDTVGLQLAEREAARQVR